MKRTTHALLTTLLVSIIGLTTLAFPASFAQPASAQQEPYWLHYDVNFASVPSWVRIRALTLRVHVGQAEAVQVIAGGRILPQTYDPASGYLVFTTSAPQVDIRLDGLSTPTNQIGEVTKAALRGDKRWAYSLTLDDGRLSVWTYGKPLFDRLGYNVGVAVIGRWFDEDGIPDGYMSKAQLTELLRAGWGLFNHSYSHFESLAIPGRVVEDVLMCNQAFQMAISGFSPLVFTVPFNDELYVAPIDANQQLLGFQVVQVGGGPVMEVDSMNWSSPPLHLGRWDISRPREAGSTRSGALYYMDYVHRVVMEDTNVHLWLSLHSHNVAPNDVAGTSLDYLHFNYGPGGTDEVWVAPADEVYQYLATRDFATVTRVADREASVDYTSSQLTTVTFGNGGNGSSAIRDTYISAVEPERNFNTPGENTVLRLRTPDQKAGLIRFDVSSIPSTARIVRATLGLYVQQHSNKGDIEIAAYSARKPWSASEATWLRAASELLWGAYGANATTGPNQDRDFQQTDKRSFRWFRYVDDYTHEEIYVDDATWNSVDVTAAVREWVSNPETNYGLILKAFGDSVEIKVASTDNPDAALRPRLVVTYLYDQAPAASSPGDPVPTGTPAPIVNPATEATPTLDNHQFLPVILVSKERPPRGDGVATN